MENLRVAIIGGGWAGISAAATLLRHASRPLQITLFEASKQLGGRARNVQLDQYVLDNGQHILMGAYHDTLQLWQQLGVIEHEVVRRQPFCLQVVQGQRTVLKYQLPTSGPHWWRLLQAGLTVQGLSLPERWALMRAIGALLTQPISSHLTVAQWLAQTRQTPHLIRKLWEPLVLAALNTPLSTASMRVFAQVLRDSVFAGASASDLLLPTQPLSALLALPALSFLQQNGVSCCLQQRVKRVQAVEQGVLVDGVFYHAVIVATAPQHTAALLTQPLPDWPQWDYHPIATVYCRYAEQVKLPYPMVGIAGGLGQWVFDRQSLYGENGMIAVVISGPGEHLSWSQDELIRRVTTEISACFAASQPLWARVVIEKRATFACVAGREVLQSTPWPHIYLAGDYLIADYPATLESAVRSGKLAATQLLNQYQ